MKSKIAKSVFAGIACAMIVFGLPLTGSAQTPTATPTPGAAVVAPPTDTNLVTFEMVGQHEIQLLGPFDSASFLLTLPANWKLTTGSSLDLRLAVIFNVLSAGRTSSNQAPTNALAAGGTLSVTLNNTLIAVIPLDQPGEVQQVIQIPDSALTSTRPDGRLLVTIGLDARFSCYGNQQMSVSVHPTSTFTLPHDSTILSTNLANFPQPIYQGSFVQDSAILAIPDQPTAADLQAALTVAAGLGNLSAGGLLLDIVPLGQLTPTLQADNHLIFVGKASSLQALAGLPLPVPLVSGKFDIPGGGADDGLVQLIVSPWSQTHAVLVVSGNSDQGALKAAQATTTGRLFTVQSPNVSVIQQVQPSLVSAPQTVDQTLADLGYRGRTFNHVGVDNVVYQFFVPPGYTLAPDAEFNLIYGHSALLNYDRSGVVVSLNNVPIGSVRLSDETAAQPTNSVHFPIPATALVSGLNTLNLRVNMIPLDDCSPLSLQGAWLQVWPESRLHLPLTPTTSNPAAGLDLARFPYPFTFDPTLGNTAFVVAHNDLPSWRGAVQIASLLGDRANGRVTTLSAFYADSLPDPERAKYNLVLVGVPGQLPIMSDLNSVLPVPFSDSAEMPSGADFQVTYRIPSGSSAGFIELMPSPWNPDNAVLAVLGNTSQGVTWATSAFTDAVLRPQLAGNFDVVSGTQVLTSDTKLSSTAAGASTSGAAPVVAVAPSVPPSGTQTGRPGWLVALIVLLALAVLLILGIVVGRNRARSKGEGPTQRGN